jgi:hypothetical protein
LKTRYYLWELVDHIGGFTDIGIKIEKAQLNRLSALAMTGQPSSASTPNGISTGEYQFPFSAANGTEAATGPIQKAAAVVFGFVTHKQWTNIFTINGPVFWQACAGEFCKRGK